MGEQDLSEVRRVLEELVEERERCERVLHREDVKHGAIKAALRTLSDSYAETIRMFEVRLRVLDGLDRLVEMMKEFQSARKKTDVVKLGKMLDGLERLDIPIQLVCEGVDEAIKKLRS